MQTSKPFHLALPIAIAAAAAMASCGGGGEPATGTLRLSLTDAPACGYDQVWVTVKKVRVHQSAGAGDGDAGWSEVVLATPQRVDLLTLTNGTLLPLGQTELPAGAYTQMRLVLDDVPPPGSPAGTLANSIKPTGSNEAELTTPSGLQSGLKMNVNLEVPAGQVADFAIDFDACKSFVRAGSKYLLKPVLSVVPILATAGQRVVGYVDPAIALPTTSVSVQVAGLPAKATVPGANGSFVLYPVPVGNYDLVVSAAGRVTAVMTGVPVTASNVTTVNALSTAILPPAVTRTPSAVTGTVTPASASVRALQTLTGGTTIEAAWAAVGDPGGAFGFTLPIEAPVRTAYVANPPALTLTPDTTALGLYTIQAQSASSVKTQNIDTKAAVPPLVFTFP